MATAQHTSALVGSLLLQHSIGPADVVDCEPELVGGTSCDAGGLLFILMYLSVHFHLLSSLLFLSVSSVRFAVHPYCLSVGSYHFPFCWSYWFSTCQFSCLLWLLLIWRLHWWFLSFSVRRAF